MAAGQETAAQSLAQLSVSTTEPLLTVPPSSSPATKKRFRSPDPVIIQKSQSPIAVGGGAAQPTGISEMSEGKRRKTAKETTAAQQSKNPAAEALSALSGTLATSKASEAPNSTTSNTSAITTAASTNAAEASSSQTSPTSTEWKGINAIQVASPGALEEPSEAGTMDNKAMSYPPPMPNVQDNAQADGKRGMSLPGSASRETKSPASNKKHKCPYCSTEFTRHHNLKSHLLTHSHEKPYLCETCDSRFRRLHDLKRHAKLHTGERPHICPKCNRRFARGDALARHAKGQGGCAGRRSSVGEYVNDEEGMEGLVYTNNQSQEPENLEEDGAAAVPSIRHHAPVQQQQQQGPYRSETSTSFQRANSTYPPIAARANMAAPGLHPPGHSSASTGQYTGPYPSGGVFPTSQMTESPKPLSPGNVHQPSADRSSSLNHSYSRRRNTPPPSLSTTSNQLPSLPSLAPPDSRYVLHSTPGGPGPSPTLPHPASGTFPPHSASNSLSSHGTGAHGSGERGHMPFSTEDRLWAVIRNLESKVERLEDEVRMLRAQNTSPSQPVSSGPKNLPPPVAR